MLLKGKIAVISGAASARGIGRATAKLFAEHGARVAVLDLDAEGAKNAAGELGKGHIGLGCDVADPASCRRAADEVISAFGQVDVLINNAGISQPLKLMEIAPENWQLVVDVNMTGVLYLSQALVPHMRSRKQGSIACMSSVSAQRGGGIFGGPHYSAAKAGVLGLLELIMIGFPPTRVDLGLALKIDRTDLSAHVFGGLCHGPTLPSQKLLDEA
jgi:NAD(P)-dependent dehydrogenase (short-subunit alcohol dehydrogenase family)